MDNAPLLPTLLAEVKKLSQKLRGRGGKKMIRLTPFDKILTGQEQSSARKIGGKN